MRYRIEITDQQEEDIIICARERSSTLERIEELLRDSNEFVFGYFGNEIIKLDLKSVYCFFTEEGRVYAETDEGRLQVKERLYQLEEVFSGDFLKINQSCLVNASKIKRFNSSVGGALLVTLENGYKDYVSRRQLRTVKERMGL